MKCFVIERQSKMVVDLFVSCSVDHARATSFLIAAVASLRESTVRARARVIEKKVAHQTRLYRRVLEKTSKSS